KPEFSVIYSLSLHDALPISYQNPVRYIDPTGMAAEVVDDIRIRDKNGNLIATYYTTLYEEDIYLHNVDVKEEINLNINKATKNLDRKSTRLNSSHVKISYAV